MVCCLPGIYTLRVNISCQKPQTKTSILLQTIIICICNIQQFYLQPLLNHCHFLSKVNVLYLLQFYSIFSILCRCCLCGCTDNIGIPLGCDCGCAKVNRCTAGEKVSVRKRRECAGFRSKPLRHQMLDRKNGKESSGIMTGLL